MEISFFLIFVAIVVGFYVVMHLIEVGVFKVKDTIEDSMMNATAHRKQEERHTDKREKL